MSNNSILNPSTHLVDQLKFHCQEEWYQYCHHEFVKRIGDGSLANESFQHYLKQDYLFLIQFARAYALAGYKATDLEDIQIATNHAQLTLKETNLHLQYCQQWNLTKNDVLNTTEAQATIAYTRYILETGMSGDLLDLYVALAPCCIGYGEISQRLINDKNTMTHDNPYWPWIESYASDIYQNSCIDSKMHLDKLANDYITPKKMTSLIHIFKTVIQLEINFWQMGLHLLN